MNGIVDRKIYFHFSALYSVANSLLVGHLEVLHCQVVYLSLNNSKANGYLHFII